MTKMGKNKLELDSKVTMELDGHRQYLTHIHHIEGEDEFIYVNQISKAGMNFRPERGTKVKVTANTKTCCYVFYGVIDDYRQIESVNTIKIERTGVIEKLQRRESFRLEKSIPVDLKIYGLYDLNSVESRATIMCADISEGGVGIHWSEPMEIDRFVDCGINIDGHYYLFRCRVARCIKEDTNQYRIGLEIINGDEHYKDKVRKYIFGSQTK